jgi:hypothetical protein
MGLSNSRGVVARRAVLAGAGSLLAAPAIVRAQGRNGVALVIGNSKYQWEAQLPNVRRDAPDIAKSFQALGLKTELIQDAGRDAMLAAIEKFKSAVAGANLAAFYFAGHGVSWDKQTHVVPVDADLGDPRAVRNLITVPSIDAAMASASNRLLVFDSCRNNPADGWRQREARAAARVDAQDRVAAALATPNTLSLFSTASGAPALDGPPGANSPFAAALLRQLDASSVDLQALPTKLRRDLLLATEGRQLVWDQSTYRAPFVVAGSGKAAPSPGASLEPARIVEVPKAYAAAAQNGLVLPQGLVALRPPTNGPDGRMIGSFEYEARIGTSTSGGTQWVRSVLIVLSLTGTDAAEVVVASKDYTTGGTGNRWRFVTATKTMNDISWLTNDEAWKLEFRWRDQNSGRHMISGGDRSSTRSDFSRPTTFTRLDG